MTPEIFRKYIKLYDKRDKELLESNNILGRFRFHRYHDYKPDENRSKLYK